MREPKDLLDVNMRDMVACLVCFTAQCVTEQLHGSSEEEDPFMRTLDERMIDWGASTCW